MKETMVGNQAPGSIAKSISILAAISLAGRGLVAVLTGERAPDFVGGTGRLIGEIIGGAVPAFVVALIAFFIVRFVRKNDRDPAAGLLSGTLAAIVVAALMFVGASH